MRVPTRSAGTRSGVNWSRLNEPPSTSATVLTVSVLASPGTPSSRTWPPASSATSRRSSMPSWPTITRLTSNSAASSASCASREGSACWSSACSRRSSGVTGSLLLVGALRIDGRVGSLTELHLDRTGVPAAHNRQFGGLARLLGEDDLPEVARGAHGPAVERRDLVASAQVRGARGTAVGDLVHDGAVAIRCIRRGDAEIGALDLAVLLQLGRDLLDDVDRHREADAGVGVGAVGGDLRVDADHAPLLVEQRAARIAGVDGGVRLHRAGDLEAVGRVDLAVQSGDDPARHRAGQAE